MEIRSAIVAIIIGIIWVIVYGYTKKRESFVRETSVALRALQDINSKYTFLDVPCLDMTHSYDNDKYYKSISPEDYLTYQLIYKHKDVEQAISDAADNHDKLQLYQAEIAASCVFAHFDVNASPEGLSGLDLTLRNYWLSKGLEQTRSVERKLFAVERKKPVTSISITICICLTNIQGKKLTSKKAIFYTPEILNLIEGLQQKTNGFYTNPELWQAICRVERGRVSNKMRFAVYKRDRNRCRKCGSTRNLEVDHIYPISKGGKTTFDNLQTLCHKCNVQKSNIIEPNAVAPKNRQGHPEKMCPNCGIPLVKRFGSYGVFWACPNFPRCKYTAKHNNN